MARKSSSKKLLKEEENRLLVALSKVKPGSVEYNAIMDELEKLYSLKKVNNETFQKVAPTLFGIAGNIAGLALVMNYERLNIIVTKAFGLAYKVRQV